MIKIENNNMKKQSISLIFIIILILYCFGILFYRCSSSPRPEHEPVEKVMVDEIISCRDYLFLGKGEDKGYGLYSYILFSKEPTNKKEQERYLKLYYAYRYNLRECKEYKQYKIEKKNLNITYWPLQVDSDKEIISEELERNYKFFIEKYDYARAKIILSKLQVITTPGPFIVVYHFPLSTITKNPPEQEILIIDFSKVHANYFSDIFIYFQNKVIDDPKTWQNKFDFEIIKIHLCSAFEAHGKPVLCAVEWVLDKYIKKVISE